MCHINPTTALPKVLLFITLWCTVASLVITTLLSLLRFALLWLLFGSPSVFFLSEAVLFVWGSLFLFFLVVFIRDRNRNPAGIQFPENSIDVARAFNWTHEHIHEYGGDGTRITLVGHSAGAHLVSSVALDATHLKRVSAKRNLKR
jgi:hypothetical protein